MTALLKVPPLLRQLADRYDRAEPVDTLEAAQLALALLKAVAEAGSLSDALAAAMPENDAGLALEAAHSITAESITDDELRLVRDLVRDVLAEGVIPSPKIRRRLQSILAKLRDL